MARLQGQTLSFLNKDDEERFIPKGDYKDALNIRRRISSGGTPYPVKNIISTLQVDFSLPAGDNLCIGEASLEENNTIYFFIWNSNSNHCIYQYNSVTNTVTLVVQDSYLNFSKARFITGVNAISGLQGEGVLLYWTDDFNAPRKINVKRAILHNQGDFVNGYAQSFSTGTDAEKAKYYDAIKHPPLFAPTFRFTNTPDRATNNIAGKVFQFRYRYIYDDGERSAYSPWSELAVSEAQKINSTSSASSYNSSDNTILVFFEPATSNNVKEIEITYREGNNGDERLYERLRNSVGIDASIFYNDGVNPLVNTDDSIKTHDAVPLLAKAQEFKENTLYYGNYVEDFNPTTIDANVAIDYGDAPDYDDRTTIPVNLILQVGFGQFQIDFSGLPTPNAGDFYFINFTITRTNGTNTFSVIGSYTAQAGDTIQDIVSFFVNNLIINSYSNTITLSISGANQDKIISSADQLILNTDVINNDSYTVSSGEAINTAKAGAYHPLGIVYFDRGGRPSTVNKIPPAYVKWYTERNGADEGYGAAAFALNIKNTPHIDAVKYSIVYAGNSTVGEYLQYTVQNVYAGKNVTAAGTGGNSFDRLYLSLRNFQGEDYSWKDSTGALPEYNFVEGDRVRVKSYIDPNTEERVIPNGYLDFRVVGYELLPNSDTENPLIESGDFPTTKELKSGYFLILEDPKIEGWDVATGTSRSTGNWFYDNNEDGEGAYIEIYRPKPQPEEQLYYEFGETYEIGDAGLSTRYHKGKNRNQNESLSYDASVNINLNVVTVQTSEDKLVVGDTIALLDGSGNTLLSTDITNITRGSTNFLDLSVSDNITSAQSSTVTISLQSEGAASLIAKGDSWYKPRVFFTGNQFPLASGQLKPFNATLASVEDYYANDYLSTSKSWDRGRPFAFSPEARRIRRKASVTNSESYFPETKYNGLSAFNPTKLIFRDYDQTWGAIQIMKQNNQGIVLWQEDKTSKILIDRNVIESAEGGGTLTTSDDKLGTQIPYAGDYGIGLNPESLCGSDGKWYWIDIKRGAALRLSLDGITPISDYKMRYFFLEKSKEYLSKYNDIKIKGGFDPINGEAVFTFPTVTETNVTVDGNALNTPIPNSEVVGSNFVINVTPVEGTPNNLTFGNEERTWGEVEEIWGEWGAPIYNSSDIAQSGIVEVESQDLGSEINAYLQLETPLSTELSFGTLNTNNGELAIPTNDASYPTIGGETTTAIEGFTIGFYEPANRWSSFYSFSPDFFGHINSVFISWKNGQLWKHEQGQGYNVFYGVAYPSRVTPVINDSPFEVKSYYASWIEGNNPWDVDLTTNLNRTDYPSSDFVDREGRYYAQLPFSETATSTSNIIGVGTISSINGNVVTVSGFDSGKSGLFVGDDVYVNSVAVAQVTALNGNTLTLSTVASVSVGDFLYVQRVNSVDGDRLRGYYVESELTNATTADEVELYSFDLISKKSFR